MQETKSNSRVTQLELEQENEKNLGYFLIKRIIDL